MRRKKRSSSILLISLSVLTIMGIIYLVLINPQTDPGSDLNQAAPHESNNIIEESPRPSAEVSETPEPPPEPVFSEAVWIGVGDIMSHMPQLPGAYDQATKSYNFDPYFAEVKPILEQGDWVMANLETPIAGADIGYSGYPTFNAPNELAEALRNAGFNLLSTANNHSLDKGEKGVLRTLELLKELELQAVGTASSPEEAEQLIIVEKNGIRMGFLAYTYGTNGIPIPQGKPYLVSLIDEQKMIADIERLREGGADVITIALHFGVEYQLTPNEEQKRLARVLVAAGADIIAGSHPHVVQPYEIIETNDKNGTPKQALIMYSMGNFISNQRGESKDYGVIFKVNIRKNMNEGTIALTDVEAIPTWVHRYKPDQAFRYRILPVEQTIAAESDKLLTPSDYATLKKDYEQLRERLDSMK